MPHLGPSGREYPEEKNGRIEIWGTDDHGNFWFVRDAGPAPGRGLPPVGGGQQPGAGGQGGSGGYPVVGGNTDPAYNQAKLSLEQIIAYMMYTGNVPPGFFGTPGAGGGGGGGSEDDALDYIAKTKPDLITALGGMGQDVSTPEAIRAALRVWFNETKPPEVAGKTIAEYAGSLGWTGGGTGGTGTGAGTGPGGRTLLGDQWDFRKNTEFPWEQEKYRTDMGERQRQFDIGTLAGLSGPRDWLKYQAAQSALGAGAANMGNLANIFWNTPAFGAATPTASWEEALRNYQDITAAGAVPQGQDPDLVGNQKGLSAPGGYQPSYGPPIEGAPGQGAEQVNIQPGDLPTGKGDTPMARAANAATGTAGTAGTTTDAPGFGTNTAQPGTTYTPQQGDWRGQFFQPGQITARAAARMTPSQRAMLEGSWAAYGTVPEDMWTKARRGWIGNSSGVAPVTRYRSY